MSEQHTPRLPLRTKSAEPEATTSESPFARPHAGDKCLGDLRAAREHAAEGRGTHAAREVDRGDGLATDGGTPPATCTNCGEEFPPDGACRSGEGHNFVAFDGGRHAYPVEWHAPKLPDAHRRLRDALLAADDGDDRIAVSAVQSAVTAAVEGR